MADNLTHMAHEESAHNALLWQRCSDDELRALEERIAADTDPAAMQQVLAVMLPALDAGERRALLAGMHVSTHREFR
jgi:hypothetical protein